MMVKGAGGAAGTELRVQECREGRLLSRLATRRQEVMHLGQGGGEWPSCRGSQGLPSESWLERKECTDSTPERGAWGGRGMRQREEVGQKSAPLARALLALTEALYMVALDQTNEDGEADKGTKTHRETEYTPQRERNTQCGQSPHNGER